MEMINETKHIDLIQINVFDNLNKYIDNKFRYIPKNVADILKNKYDELINTFIEYENFNVIYGNAWGGIGVGDIQVTVYENKNDYNFCENYHYSSSSFHIYFEINKKLMDNCEFIKIIDDIKKKLLDLWINELYNFCKI